MTTLPPLAGLKVVELARVLAGPWAGQVLADLGASVVKSRALPATTRASGARPRSTTTTARATPRISIPPIEASARSPSI
jgi:crotonobetainyl-CoA:carnitine CoA-transferase CaiB-like acyl-CoA transferase